MNLKDLPFDLYLEICRESENPMTTWTLLQLVNKKYHQSKDVYNHRIVLFREFNFNYRWVLTTRLEREQQSAYTEIQTERQGRLDDQLVLPFYFEEQACQHVLMTRQRMTNPIVNKVTVPTGIPCMPYKTQTTEVYYILRLSYYREGERRHGDRHYVTLSVDIVCGRDPRDDISHKEYAYLACDVTRR